MKVAGASWIAGCAVAAALAGAAAACGSSSPQTTPSPTPTPTSTVTITTGGTNPKDIVIAPGSQVTFLNNDTRSHNVSSDPHPEHTDCPSVNQVGVLVTGQSRQTGNLNIARVCGYHDHDMPDDSRWKGTITIR
jgi:plastocyanin